MESTEIKIKPAISEDDIPDKSSLTVSGVTKLKHSRYEDVWPEDVHAAFMEAIALYPPMGKRRLKYYRVSTHQNEQFLDINRAKSFGRCQLIQSYILEKTGKNRSRKQVSSHLQRLKKINKNNPAMLPLFSERSQPPSEHCAAVPQIMSPQDILTDISAGTRHLKSDLDLAINHLQNTDTSAVSPPTSYASEASPFRCNPLNISTDFPDQPSFSASQEFIFPVSQQCLAGVAHPPDDDYFSEFQDASLFKDVVNDGFRPSSAFSTPAFSVSLRRIASRLPIQGRLSDLGPTMHFSRVAHSPAFQPIHHPISHDSLTDGVSCNSPFAPAQEAFHTPFLPLQSIPSEKQRLHSGLASEYLWPKHPDIPIDLREGSLSEICLRYPAAMYQYNSVCSEMRVNTPMFYSSPSESEVSRLPRGNSYSYTITSPTTMSETVSNEVSANFPRYSPESSEIPVSPLVIRPTPIYPISYTHLDLHSNIHTPAPTLPS